MIDRGLKRMCPLINIIYSKVSFYELVLHCDPRYIDHLLNNMSCIFFQQGTVKLRSQFKQSYGFRATLKHHVLDCILQQILAVFSDGAVWFVSACVQKERWWDCFWYLIYISSGHQVNWISARHILNQQSDNVTTAECSVDNLMSVWNVERMTTKEIWRSLT